MKLPDAIFDMRNCYELPCNTWKTFSKYMHLWVFVAKIMFTTQYNAQFILILTVTKSTHFNNNQFVVQPKSSLLIVVDFIIFHMFTGAEAESRTWFVSNARLLQNSYLYFGGMMQYEHIFEHISSKGKIIIFTHVLQLL